MRFPEFSGEWTQCTIGSYGNIITGSTPSTNDTENYDNGTYLWASPTDLGELKYIEQTQTKLTDKGFGKTRSFPANSILVTCIGSTIGKMGMSKVEMSTNQQINTIVPTGHDANFVFYTIQSRFPRYLSSIAVQAVPIISKSAFEKLENYTTSIDEEVKIGTFLSLLDERIATQNKIIEDLKKLKVAICNKLIDNLVNHEPLIRFTEVYSKAGEGGTPETSKSEYYENGNIPFIKIDDLSNKYIISNKDFITDLGLQKSSAWIIPTHSLIYSNGATIGAISINTYEVCTKQGILGIVPQTSISVEYLYCLMSSNYFSKQVHRIITHGTMATAYLKDINKIKVPIPCMQKQLEIANTISSVTNKIGTELNILSLLLKQKQYLLQQMFI
ncbi:MAG: restriction endonuclease subunit S [Bacteroidaceae bacterium]|nr:restriction endonuclease subunit S [Bacteroidaceae bacterium]